MTQREPANTVRKTRRGVQVRERKREVKLPGGAMQAKRKRG